MSALLAALIGLAAGPALAQEGAAEGGETKTVDEEEQAAKHFANGRKLYGEEKYEEAISELLKAYEMRPAPPILLNIARTYEKLKDKKNALRFYKEYLLKARMMDPNRPMVEKVVKELEAEVGGGTGAVTSAIGTETTEVEQAGGVEPGVEMARKPSMIHTPVDSGKYTEPITLMAELPPNVEANFVVVQYRQGGELKFRQMAMEQQGEAYVGKIPAKHVTSTSIQYYIEAINTRKGVVAVSGTKRNPHIIVIEGGKRIVQGPADGADKIDVGNSPYWVWMWVAGGLTVASFGVGGAMGALAADRSNALSQHATERSCTKPCRNATVAGQFHSNPPKYPWDHKLSSGSGPEDWESEGKTFDSVFIAMMAVGGAAAVATAVLVFFDRKWHRDAKLRLEANELPRTRSVRFLGSPWISPEGAGVMGQITF
jgi:hypothetical protein